MKNNRSVKVSKQKDGYGISFNAMASPCEVLIQTQDQKLAEQVAHCVSQEVWRIEDKYSRYDPASLCSQINTSDGLEMVIDEETYLLLNFAEQCYQLSDGLFDLSSGVLQKVWRFSGDRSDEQYLPSETDVREQLNHVGWRKITFNQSTILLPRGMQLDFGGIGKEYAVDRCILLAKKLTDKPLLINFGGDLAVTGPRKNNQAWQVGIEHPECDLLGQKQEMIVAISQGALATSGDSRRYILNKGIRYGHVLNAKTGWPIMHAPRSITTAAPQCIQAGILATLALLQGQDAEAFLSAQEITFWARR